MNSWKPELITDLISLDDSFRDPAKLKSLFELFKKHSVIQDSGVIDDKAVDAIVASHPDNIRDAVSRMTEFVKFWIQCRKNLKNNMGEEYNGALPIFLNITPAILVEKTNDKTKITQAFRNFSETIPPIEVCPKCNIALPLPLDQYALHKHCGVDMELL